MAKKYPPLKYVFAACVQCLSVGFVYGIYVMLTYFPMGPIVALTAKRGESPFGRPHLIQILERWSQCNANHHRESYHCH